ncbi:hypothetical protein HER15_08105 [Tenacibaculum mesophilum]|uniref:Uncharacterized protein n=1 Tax=Tenacibaculum mesophilum TaxID=104268 RepID=A0AAE9MNS2_9FLAO|nr:MULTISPECIES: hypothetical protein [Tenacibaculum]MCO7183894.1 hypothetical protein [Tenacibaculum sp. XPcli2-G]UTD15429.1 hypothetical protein HER15_08105 [Tenacibaculum mesophilum]
MDYYYQKQINELERCPPDDYKNIKCVSYRWVFKDINDRRNFIAQAEKNPKSLNDKTDLEKCAIYALSFHNSIENSQRHFSILNKKFKNIKKRLGTHIAKGSLVHNDGVGSNIDKNGHFNFHHLENCNLNERFEIIRILE